MFIKQFLETCRDKSSISKSVIFNAAHEDLPLFLTGAVFLRSGARGTRASQNARSALLWFVRNWESEERIVALLQALAKISKQCWDDFVLFWNKCHVLRPRIGEVIMELYASTLHRKLDGHVEARASLPHLGSQRNKHGFVETLMRFQPTGPSISSLNVPLVNTAVTRLDGVVVVIDNSYLARVSGAYKYAKDLFRPISGAHIVKVNMDADFDVDMSSASKAIIVMTPRPPFMKLNGLTSSIQSFFEASPVPTIFWETVSPVSGHLLKRLSPLLYHATGFVPYTLDFLLNALETPTNSDLDETLWLQALSSDPLWGEMYVAQYGPAMCILQ